MNWTDKIAGCFGNSDLIFAGHAIDEKRSFELLAYLRDNGVGWAKVWAEFEAFLNSKDANQAHIAQQLGEVERYYRCWLID